MHSTHSIRSLINFARKCSAQKVSNTCMVASSHNCSNMVYRRNEHSNPLLDKKDLPLNSYNSTQLYSSRSGFIKNKFAAKEDVKETEENKGNRLSKERNSIKFDSELIEKLLDSTAENWQDIKDKHNEKQRFEMKHFSTKFMAVLSGYEPFSEEILNLGKNLVTYAEEKGESTAAFMASYAVLCSKSTNPKDHEMVTKCYLDVLEKTGNILDVTLTGFFNVAFAATENWRECYKLVDILSSMVNVTSRAYTPVLLGRIKDNDLPEVWHIFENMGKDNLVPDDQVFNALCDVVDNEDMDRLIHFCRNYRWYPSVETAKKIESFYQRNSTKNLKGSLTKILSRHKSICPACNTKLEPMQKLSHEEFCEMREAFLRHSLIKKDIFLNTTPEELELFNEKLEKNGPYDVVIDGLNVSYTGRQTTNKNIQSKRLADVVKTMSKKGLKVLVIGRDHMQYWPTKTMQTVYNNADTFWTKNLSQDDPFMLHATLFSGPRTLFVTKDELRDHRFLLGEDLAERFKCWQRSHQVVPMGTKYDSHNVLLLWPKKHETRVQKSASNLHIPVNDLEIRSSYELPELWLCLQMENSDKNVNSKGEYKSLMDEDEPRSSAKVLKNLFD